MFINDCESTFRSHNNNIPLEERRTRNKLIDNATRNLRTDYVNKYIQVQKSKYKYSDELKPRRHTPFFKKYLKIPYESTKLLQKYTDLQRDPVSFYDDYINCRLDSIKTRCTELYQDMLFGRAYDM